jgi:hypothetical protein
MNGFFSVLFRCIVVYNVQVTAPFLHIGGVSLMTFVSFIIADRFMRLPKSTKGKFSMRLW